ncbi:MAG: polysaccharide deacetylase family protein [Chitinophagaceae bacterium]
MHKALVFVTVIFLSALSGITAQTAPPQLIIRGDDMGFSHSGNLALIKTYKEGIEKSIEIIVPSPWFPEAVKLLQENPGVDVGVHLALTSEWDNVKWRPVSVCPSLTDKDGYFYPKIWADKNYPNGALVEHNWKLEDIEKEFRAQIQLAKEKVPRISHVSAHMGCVNMNAEVTALARKLAKEYNIDIDLKERGVQSVGFNGPHATFKEKKESFLKMLATLQPGQTYMFLEHPGLDNEELRAIHHIGYENVAEDRQGVTDLWTDKEVRTFITKHNIQLIGYNDLLK